MGIRRLNHAVLNVRDVTRSVQFYTDVLGFRVVQRRQNAAFLRATESDNDHDLGLFQARGSGAERPSGVGLYHLAWSVGTLPELADFAQRLAVADALVGSSDHGVSKSLYGKDPDGLEFEISWFVPRDRVTEEMSTPTIGRLDIAAEILRWGADLAGAP
ncbi:VOC family protein [Actinophytocola sp.]|uniref:VOC family protein n=1 Tax=Actinophytocola sp. TaxID=1872138 RepID=UPI002D43AFA2|nr:VOC family protein [Actinophytocola sp.]HYQ65497.1 VOC family protein [Actinophytocola sp.]